MAKLKISNELSDAALLVEVGARLAQRRIAFRLTQAGLAEQAGISKRTLERAENGFSVQLQSLLRILRVLDLVEGLEVLIPAAEQSPMDLLQRQGRQRKRAFTSRGVAEPKGKWTWGEDT